VGLYNFQKRFVPFILSGAKQHTIRATRRNVDQPGGICHLYTGLRQPGAQLIGRFPCTRVEEIRILDGGNGDPCSTRVFIAGVELDQSERAKLARLDGFKCFSDMANFWKGRTPFEGHIIHWKWSKGDCGFEITHEETK
jgi:hypothetical protein